MASHFQSVHHQSESKLFTIHLSNMLFLQVYILSQTTPKVWQVEGQFCPLLSSFVPLVYPVILPVKSLRIPCCTLTTNALISLQWLLALYIMFDEEGKLHPTDVFFLLLSVLTSSKLYLCCSWALSRWDK